MPRELTIDIHGKYVEDALAEVRDEKNIAEGNF